MQNTCRPNKKIYQILYYVVRGHCRASQIMNKLNSFMYRLSDCEVYSTYTCTVCSADCAICSSCQHSLIVLGTEEVTVVTGGVSPSKSSDWGVGEHTEVTLRSFTCWKSARLIGCN